MVINAKGWRAFLTAKLETGCGLSREEAAKQAVKLLKWISRSGDRSKRPRTISMRDSWEARPLPHLFSLPVHESKPRQSPRARAADL
jgi:hypothetical protein